jgi:hypothetical protein
MTAVATFAKLYGQSSTSAFEIDDISHTFSAAGFESDFSAHSLRQVHSLKCFGVCCLKMYGVGGQGIGFGAGRWAPGGP